MLKTNLSDYEKVGGWLTIVFLGLFLSIGKIIYALGTQFVPLFTDNSIFIILNNINSFKNFFLIWFIYFEIFFNVAEILFCVYLLLLMKTRSVNFPRLAIAFYVANFIGMMLDLIGYAIIQPSEGQPDSTLYNEVVRSFFMACIWIPYLIKSKRVKKTFTVDEDKKDPSIPERSPLEAL